MNVESKLTLFIVETPIPVAVQSKAYVCGRLDAGFESRSGHGYLSLVFICCVVLCSRGLCDGLITRPEESYRVSSCMCDHRNPERGPICHLGT
jgi:hypothetical protein